MSSPAFRPLADLIPAHWTEGTVPANGIQVHYWRTGGDKPPLVLLHGFTDDGLCWLRVARDLQADYDVLMPDTRGHGRSSGPTTGYSWLTPGADTLAFVRALGLARPILMGHSMGAVAAVMAAAGQPDLPAALILEDPPARALPPPTTDEARAWLNRWIADIRARQAMTPDERMAAALREWQPGTPLWDELEMVPWVESKALFNLAVLTAAPGMTDMAPWQAALTRLTCPVLLLAGDAARGSVLTDADLAALAASAPSVRIVRFPTGHNIRREAYEAYMAAVREFLREVSTAS